MKKIAKSKLWKKVLAQIAAKAIFWGPISAPKFSQIWPIFCKKGFQNGPTKKKKHPMLVVMGAKQNFVPLIIAKEIMEIVV